jgi:hypothetical protein
MENRRLDLFARRAWGATIIIVVILALGGIADIVGLL